MKKKQITATQRCFFTAYRDMKFKLTAHRLDSENRNTVIWNKNYRNTAPKITQYHKPLGLPPLKQRLKATQKWPDMVLKILKFNKDCTIFYTGRMRRLFERKRNVLQSSSLRASSQFGRVKRATRASGEAARRPVLRCRVSPRVPLARVLFMIFPKLAG